MKSIVTILVLLIVLYSNNVSAQTTFNAKFFVHSNQVPVENAEIKLEGYQNQLTDSEGLAIFTEVAASDSLFYSISKEGYLDYSDSIAIIDANITETINLTAQTWSITFDISSEDEYFTSADIFLEDYGIQTTNDDGITTFVNVSFADELAYSISANGYHTISGTITSLTSDTTITHFMDPKGYKVLFKVLSKGDEVQDATIKLGNLPEQITDANGETTFVGLEPASNLLFTVSKEGYTEFSGSLSISNQNVLMPISLETLSYSVIFSVFSDNSPVLGVRVDIDDTESNYTDKNGIARFSNIEGGTEHKYKISKTGIITQTGVFSISKDDTLNFNVVIGGIDTAQNAVKIFPNPASGEFTIKVGQLSNIQIIDLNGLTILNAENISESLNVSTEKFNAGLYIVQIKTTITTINQILIIP